MLTMKKNHYFLLLVAISTIILLCCSLQIAEAVNYINPVHTGSISNNDFQPVVAFPEWNTIDGDYLYYGSNIADAVTIVDISDPANLIEMSTIFDGEGGAELKGPKGITISGDNAFVITNTLGVGDTLEILNISDKSNPYHEGSIVFSNGTWGSYVGAYSVTVDGDYAYIGASSDDKLIILDISDPTNPVEIGSIADGEGGASLDNPYQVQVVDYAGTKYAYITAYSGDSLEIVDVTDPSNPTHKGYQ